MGQTEKTLVDPHCIPTGAVGLFEVWAFLLCRTLGFPSTNAAQVRLAREVYFQVGGACLLLFFCLHSP